MKKSFNYAAGADIIVFRAMSGGHEVHLRQSCNRASKAGTADAVTESARRYLPAPHTAPELAQMDAALNAPISQGYATKARVLVGTAVIAFAVTIPDPTVGAMGSPYMRIDLGAPVTGLPETVWTPSAHSVGPVYAPVAAAERLASPAVTLSGSDRATLFEQDVPLQFLATGAERFELAFSGIEGPAPLPLALTEVDSVALPPRMQPRPKPGREAVTDTSKTAPAPNARLVAIDQIAVSRDSRAAQPPGLREAMTGIDPGISADGRLIEAAFAGAIDVSRGNVAYADIADGEGDDPFDPAAQPMPRALPIPAPDPALDASVAAQRELVAKSRLDARINGVLAGSVEFRQLDGTIAIRLGSVVDMLHERFSASEYEYLRAGESGDTFVTLADLQGAGIPIKYNPAYDEVEFGIDYDDAPQAAKVQLQQIGAPTVGADRVLIDQIPR